MSRPERAPSGLTRLLSGLTLGLGVLLIIRTLSAGGGALSIGTLLGVAFVLVGLGRLYLSRGPT